ncbi:substrate-binding periplasmic protein [Roseateles sp. PN1]|uniref:substrate-binding periplasmic protein n=1 Tax=Roseateles sp. PN1 TaxID=3137372 RepID=UPI00313A1E37
MIKFLRLLAALAWCGTAAAAESVTLAFPDYPGYVDGQGRGLYVELARAVFPPPQFELHVTIVPFARALTMLTSGEGVVVPGTNDPGPGGRLSKQVTDMDLVSAAVLRQRFPLWLGIETLRNKYVVAQIGYGYQRYTDVPMEYREIHDIGSMLRMLVRGRVDAVLDYGPRITEALRYVTDAQDVEIRPAVLRKPMFFAFRASPSGDLLRARFDSEFLRLQNSGELLALFQRHPLVQEQAYPPAIRR